VTDEEAFAAMRLLARTEGLSVEVASGVAFAGLDKLFAQGIIKRDEIVVINCSGHTFPVDKHITDEESLLDSRLSQPAGSLRLTVGAVKSDKLVTNEPPRR
jgi:threonine synthase